MNQLLELMSHVSLGEPIRHINMAVYPLYVPNGHTRAYRTLDDGLSAGEVEIMEVTESGSVPNLAVNNKGTVPVLLVVGEELIGAKQNRVLNTSLLVAAHTQLTIPVSCVEQGRWGYRSRSFSSGDTTSHLQLRRKQTENVTTNLRERHAYDANQHEVWGEVTRKLSSHFASSQTAALHDMYQQTHGSVQEYMEAFQTPPDSEGFLVTINSQIAGGDLFDHHETLHSLWKKLIRGYAIDALEKQAMTVGGGEALASSPEERLATQQFLEVAKTAHLEEYDSIGLGKDLRLSNDDLTGSSLIWEGRAIHTSLFKRA